MLSAVLGHCISHGCFISSRAGKNRCPDLLCFQQNTLRAVLKTIDTQQTPGPTIPSTQNSVDQQPSTHVGPRGHMTNIYKYINSFYFGYIMKTNVNKRPAGHQNPRMICLGASFPELSHSVLQ